MSEVIKRNPATKLFEVIDEARSYDMGVFTKDVWSGVFDMPDELDQDDVLFKVLESLVALRKLFNETINSLHQIPDINEELFIEPIRRLARIVDLHGLHKEWGDYKKYILPQDMHSLKYCEFLLSRHTEYQENIVPDEELKAILKGLNELYESVIASSLPSELKQSILTLIQDIRQAIHLYRINGAEALREALTKSMGVIIANKDSFEENKDASEVQSLMNMLVRIDKLYTFAIKMKPVLEAAANIIPALAAHIK
ncbi:MAG: hypothetical protein ICV60_05630 [Pyrinomonadaceae bacterium]|nr:hypothetical protein [Pyrinomonadaceae bacterium]